MAQLPVPYLYGPDRFVRMYNDLLKKNFYWPWPMSSLTGNYVTLDLANYLFDSVQGTENDLLADLPVGATDSGSSYSDDLQTMYDQGNHVTQSAYNDGGYSMDEFPKSTKNRRKGLATIDITDYQDYGTVTQTREGISALDAVDLDQQIHSTVGLSAEQFMAVAQVQGLLVPYLSTFEGRPVEQIARVSLATFIGAIIPTILSQLPTQVSPTNPTNPTKVLSDFSRNGPDSIIEGIMDTQYRANVIYSDGTSGVVVTQGKAIDGFYWNIIGQGEQISLTGILPIYPNDTYGDGRSFILELRHVSLPAKVDRGTIQIIDGTVAPPPPSTAEPFIELLIDADARSIRVRYRLANATRAALSVFRDGAIIYASDNLPAAFDTSLNQTVSPGTYYAVAYEPNNDSNRRQSAPQTIKETPVGSSVVTAIDYAHKAKGTDGFPELDLWFNASVNEDIAYTLKTEDLPETNTLPTKAYSGSDGYIRQQQQTNVRGGQLVTIKAWTLSNAGGAISKQFRIVAGATRTTIYGAATTTPPADTATIITAIDTAYDANGALITFVKTSRADGVQFAVANDQGQYSGWFAGTVVSNDPSGYQYGGNFSAAGAGSKQQIRYRPSTNSAESAIAYLSLVVPNGAQARKAAWANGAQLQPVSGDFSVDYVDSNLGSTPIVLFRILPIWNDAGTQVRFRRIFTGQIPDGFTEYWTFDKEGLFPDPNKAVNPFQGRDIENVIWFPPNYVLHLECFWARGAEVNRGYAYGYCAAIGGATIYTGTKPIATT